MAEPKKTAQGTWRIIIEVRGVRDSKTLPTRREAIAWRDARVAELRAAHVLPLSDKHTLRDALRQYARDVSPNRSGRRAELIRLEAFERQALPLDVPMGRITTQHLAAWRDSRLAVNAKGSVLRDISLLGAVLETARREWGWLQVNPLADMRKPSQPPHRERVVAGHELRAMLRALGHDARGHKVRTVSQAVGLCALLAVSTGMRAGELCGLTWAHVHAAHVHLPKTKNGDTRDVPLSKPARRIIERMRGWDADLVFGLKAQTLDAMWRKYRQRAGLQGFTFHDLRHTAATQMAKKLHVLELCKVMGWRRTDQALTYFNPKAADLAARLG